MHEDDDEQHEGALPVVGQIARHLLRDPAFLEVPRQQREAHQQQEQVGEDDPLVLHVQRKAAEPGTELESGEDDLVERDRGKPRERHLQRVVMK